MTPLGLFEGFGVEIEMMIVDAATLDVKPVCDRLMEAVAGEPASELEMGPIAWSNELALHVLELKTNGPAGRLEGLGPLFQQSLLAAEAALAPLGARLMPGGMHPWMDPVAELRLWPHEYTEVYRTFDRIFGCRGHGWANLQSTHVNLPFASDEEFGRLHEAVRLVLPLLPALAASSPLLEGAPGPALDNRLLAYRDNARRIPAVTGAVVPEPVASRADYDRVILDPIYRELAPHDPEGVLRHEWANARGAIARFGRGTVEIRVLDAQECPACDLAVVAAVVHMVRGLAEGVLREADRPASPPTAALAALLERTVREGQDAVVGDPALLALLGAGQPGAPCTAGELCEELLAPLLAHVEWGGPLRVILREGPLAARILGALGGEPDRGRVRDVYEELCDCLRAGRPFRAG